MLARGKRPRATLTPTLALKDGKPFLVLGLNVVEFGMTVQEATEAANITSYPMRDSFGEHQSFPGRLTLNTTMPPRVRKELTRMGCDVVRALQNTDNGNAIVI